MASIQIRTQEMIAGRIHLQGAGEPMNRKYGLSVEIRVPPEVTDWLGQMEPTLQSFASKDTLYVPVELVDDGEGHRLLIEGDELNDERGMLLELSDESPNVGALIQFATENELIDGGEEE